MSDIKLFSVGKSGPHELSAKYVNVERSLQTHIETHMETFFGVRFLASEYSTSKVHSGRIDSLGLDENGCPVIFEYKRASNENVISQGLFYLDWLMDHRPTFKLLVMEKLDKKSADNIEWSTPRLICIAGDFKKYDEHAVLQINRNIELVRYRKYSKGLILFELINATTTQNSLAADNGKPVKHVGQHLAEAGAELRDLFESVKAYIEELGDDVQMRELKHYFAFKRIRNFACVEVHKKKRNLLLYLRVDPKGVNLEKGFTRDVGNIGHSGTGDLEVSVTSREDFEKAKDLILKSYEGS